MLPHFVVINYRLDTDIGDTPVGAFETSIRKPISHLQGDIVKLTISNIILELVGDTIKFSRVVVVKCEDLILQNHDAELGSVIFQTVPTLKADNAVSADSTTTPVTKAVDETFHTAHVDPVCLYCANPVGIHRLRFKFVDQAGAAYDDILSFTATMKFESIQ